MHATCTAAYAGGRGAVDRCAVALRVWPLPVHGRRTLAVPLRPDSLAKARGRISRGWLHMLIFVLKTMLFSIFLSNRCLVAHDAYSLPLYTSASEPPSTLSCTQGHTAITPITHSFSLSLTHSHVVYLITYVVTRTLAH